jgi:hypothetical protein
VTRWLRYGYGRVETQADACATAQIQDAFAASGDSVEGLLLALVRTEATRYRRRRGARQGAGRGAFSVVFCVSGSKKKSASAAEPSSTRRSLFGR